MAEPRGPTCWEWYTWPWEPLRKTWRDDKACCQDGHRPTIQGTCHPLGWDSQGTSCPIEPALLPAGPGRPCHAMEGGAGPWASCFAPLPSPIHRYPATLGRRAAAGRQAGQEEARLCLGKTSGARLALGTRHCPPLPRGIPAHLDRQLPLLAGEIGAAREPPGKSS